MSVHYGDKPAVRDVDFDIGKNEITALIGPSGCGKSTLIRCLNRMNDLIPTRRVEGEIALPRPGPLRAATSTPVEVRKRIGMVFQKPNPFPKSIYDNIAFGPRVLGHEGRHGRDRRARAAQRRAVGRGQGPPQDERLRHVGRPAAAPVHRPLRSRSSPDVILMDEPCSALDPISTGRIEDLMLELKQQYSIVIVTHNMQQAARVSDRTAFLTVDLDDDEKNRSGPPRRVRRHREDLHEPVRLADRGLRHRQGRLAMSEATRTPLPGGAADARGAGARRARHGRQRARAHARGACEHQDVELASIVIADDDRIDGRYLEVHQGVLSLLARQAPVATDLRLVAAVLHVIKHVERMGDQCVNIGKLLPLAGHEPPADERILAKIQRMGEQAPLR